MVWIVEAEGRGCGRCLSEICACCIGIDFESLLFSAYRGALCLLLGEREGGDVFCRGDVGPRNRLDCLRLPQV